MIIMIMIKNAFTVSTMNTLSFQRFVALPLLLRDFYQNILTSDSPCFLSQKDKKKLQENFKHNFNCITLNNNKCAF